MAQGGRGARAAGLDIRLCVFGLLPREEVEKQTRLQFEAAEIEQGVGVRTLRDLIDIRLEYEQAGLQTIRTRYDLLRERLRLMSLTSQFSFNETL